MKYKEKRYFLLNKPAGFVCALKDNIHPTIMEFAPKGIKDLHIVGRLDIDTTGLIMLTNDGQYTHWSTRPQNLIPKTYEVTLERIITNDNIKEIELGLEIDHGQTKLKPAKVHVVHSKLIHLTIVEGKFHQVKKMMRAINNQVVGLKRISYDKWNLVDLVLEEGEIKEITL